MGTIREDIEAMFTDDELMEIAGCAEVDAWGDPRNALGLVASWAVHVAKFDRRGWLLGHVGPV